MALDKLVDSTQLNNSLTSIANAIRTRGSTSGQLAFPAGFISAIQDIPSGGTLEALPYQVRLGGVCTPVSTSLGVNLQWAWIDTTFAAGITIRRKLGAPPEHISDGKLACTINGTATTTFFDADFDVDDPAQVGSLASPVNWYYRAFPLNSEGQGQTYTKAVDNLGVATIGVYAVESSTYLSALPVWTEVEFGRWGTTPLVFDVASVYDGVSGQTDRVQLIAHQSYFGNKYWDAKEPDNPNSDRKNYGNNRWLYSNMRQWLNASGEKGTWFTPQHDYDVLSSALDLDGFLFGFTASERSLIIPETHVMRVPNLDGGGTETMVDTVWLPSRVEMGNTASDATGEGTRFQMFDGDYNTDAYRKKNWETNYWLRSAYVGHANSAWCVTSAGGFSHDLVGYSQYAVRPGLSLPLSTPVIFDDASLRYKVQIA